MELNVNSSPRDHFIYAPLHRSQPSFFQERAFLNNPLSFLSQDALKKSLLSSRVTRLQHVRPDPSECSEMMTVIICAVVTLAVSYLFGAIFTVLFRGPVDQPVSICGGDFTYYIRNNQSNQSTVNGKLNFPCYMQYEYNSKNIHKDINGRYYSIEQYTLVPTYVAATVAAMCLACVAIYFSPFIPKLYRTYKANASIDQDNENIDQVISDLSYLSDVTSEALPRDIAMAFRYLPEDQLVLLNFSQLKKAKKLWGELFQQRLDSCLFSKQQLCIWHLFNHIIVANSKEKTIILKEKLSQDIIGSDSHFFQTVIREVKPRKEEDVLILSQILKTHILTEKFASSLDLPAVIKSVSEGGKLKKVIASLLAPQEAILSLSEEKNEIEDHHKRISHFLETGKLSVQNVDDGFELLETAIDLQENDAIDCLEAYLSDNIHKNLDYQCLSSLLERLTELELDDLMHKVDQLLVEQWEEKPCPIFSDLFEELYSSAKEYGLVLFSHKIGGDYIEALTEWEISFPFNANIVSNQINAYLEQFDRLFGERQDQMVQILLDKINAFIKKYPDRMEDLLKAAKRDNNIWLIDCIKHIYNRNPEYFADYFLSPPFHDLEEVIVEAI